MYKKKIKKIGFQQIKFRERRWQLGLSPYPIGDAYDPPHNPYSAHATRSSVTQRFRAAGASISNPVTTKLTNPTMANADDNFDVIIEKLSSSVTVSKKLSLENTC